MHNEEEEINLEHEELMDSFGIDVNDLPQKVQSKIQKLNELCDEYEELDDEEDDAQNDLLLQIQALDDGIVADLEPIIAKIKEDDEKEKQAIQPNPEPNQQTENTNSDSPSWRFWM